MTHDVITPDNLVDSLAEDIPESRARLAKLTEAYPEWTEIGANPYAVITQALLEPFIMDVIDNGHITNEDVFARAFQYVERLLASPSELIREPTVLRVGHTLAAYDEYFKAALPRAGERLRELLIHLRGDTTPTSTSNQDPL